MSEETIVQEETKYIVKLSWKNLWIVSGILLSVIGGSFGAGIKVQTEMDKIVQAKIEQDYMGKLNAKDLQLFEWQRKSKEFEESAIFFKGQYLIQLDRYTKCSERGVFDKILPTNDENK